MVLAAVDPGVLCFAPWIACPPCCFSVLSRDQGVGAWLRERWIGPPSLRSSLPLPESSSLSGVTVAAPAGAAALTSGRTSAFYDTPASGVQSSTVVHFVGSHVHGSPAWHLEQFIAAAAPGVAALRERRIALLEDAVEREFAYLAAQQHSDGFLADLRGFVDELDMHTSTVLHDGGSSTFDCEQQSQQQQQLSGPAASTP